MPLTTVDQGLLSTNAQYTGFKNRVINGDMQIDQRNAGASVSVTNSFAFPVDRFIGVTAASTTVAFQRSTTAPSGFVNSLSCTVTTPKVLAASDINRIIHRIEGFNTSDFAFGTSSATPITLSFWVRSSVTGTYTVTFVGGQSYMATYVINAANTWEYKTITISGSTSGSWPTDNTTGLELNFNLGAGTDWQGTAGSWINTTARFTVSGAANFIGTNGATFFLTGVQLEKGQTATSFDVLPFGTELALCQRYFELSGIFGVSSGNAFAGGAGNSSTRAFTFSGNDFKVQKRAVPTISIRSSQTGTANQISGYSSGTEYVINDINSISINRVAGFIQVTSSFNSFEPQAYFWQASAGL